MFVAVVLLVFDVLLGISLLQWVSGLVISGIVSAVVGKPIIHWLRQRTRRHNETEQWYRNMRSVAIRIDKRFTDTYIEPHGEPELEEVYMELEPLVRELEELVGDPPDHDGADSTVHFAENLRKWCVRLNTGPEHVKTRQDGYRPHMRGPMIVSYCAERLEHRADTEIQRF